MTYFTAHQDTPYDLTPAQADTEERLETLEQRIADSLTKAKELEDMIIAIRDSSSLLEDSANNIESVVGELQYAYSQVKDFGEGV